jgi:hypothetical protein
MRQDSATKAYLQRRLAEGKTVRDIKKCLKRYIARQLFRQLEALPQPLTTHRSVPLAAAASSDHRNGAAQKTS